MSDIRYDTYQHYGTNAERLAFVPAPPSASLSKPIYIWFETDTLTTWLYYTAWVQITGAGATGVVQVNRVTLTDANIKALPTTPFTLKTAPGAAKRLVFLGATSVLNTAAGAYTNFGVNGPFAVIKLGASDISDYLSDNNSALSQQFQAILTTATDWFIEFHPLREPDIVTSWWNSARAINGATALKNTALTLNVNNGAAGNFTGGNAANTWVIDIYYAEVAA